MIQPDFNIGVALGLIMGYCIHVIQVYVDKMLEEKRRGKK